MIFKRELMINLKSLILWSIVLGGLSMLTLSLYPEIAKQQESLKEMIKTYPESLIKAFDLDKLGFGDILEYYATKGYSFVALFGSIYAIMVGSSVLSKEENDKTIEFLLSKPISRKQIITQKLLAVFALITILNLILTLINFIGAKIGSSNNFDISIFLLLSLAPLLLHLTFGAISFLISTRAKRTRTVLSLSMGMVLITYILHIISKTSSNYETLKYFTPFEYTNAVDVITKGSMQTTYLCIIGALILLSILLSYKIYTRKNILT